MLVGFKSELRSVSRRNGGRIHPEYAKTVDQVFAEEKIKLIALPVSPFNGYQETITRVSLQLLINFDRNNYSVNAMAVGKSVQVRAYPRRSHCLVAE